MYGDTDRGGAATTLRFVTCDLSSLTDCGCITSPNSNISGSSTKRKTRASGSLIDPDCFTALSAKRLILGRPSLIDRLISRNKSALEMEGRKRGPGRPPGALSGKNKVDPKDALKRKRTESMNGTSPAIKRLRSTKEGSESDSSESRNTSLERKRGRPPSDKLADKKSPKKSTRKIERRFSVRIHHSSLRSGKKRKELLALKQRRIRNLTKEAKGKKKWVSQDKTDSNSNVCPENDSNDEVDESTDSELSRETSESSDLTVDNKNVNHEQKSPDEDIKKKRKRRKRDSMWVRKVKKQIKAKVLSPNGHFLALENNGSVVDDAEIPEALETSDIPILNKESDESLIIDNSCKAEPVSNILGTEDVAMPKLEKEVDLPSEKSQDDHSEKNYLNSENKVDVDTHTNLYSENNEDSHSERNKDLVTVKNEILLSDKSEDLDSGKNELQLEEKCIEVMSSAINIQVEDSVFENNITGCSTEDRMTNDSSSKTDFQVEMPSEKFDLPEDISLNENLINQMPSEENGVVSVHIREPETVDNERKELNISYEEISVAVTEQVCEAEEKISSDDQIINTEQHMKIAVLEDCLPVMNKKLSTSEENNLEISSNEQNNGLENGKVTDIVESNNKSVNGDLETDLSGKTENSIENQHDTADEVFNSDMMEIKEEPLIDADSTSDVKPSLDDSFPEFSLSLPDDLDLDSSLSDEHEDRTLEEESDRVLPDSTEEAKLQDSKTDDYLPFPSSTESFSNNQFPIDSVPNGDSRDTLEGHQNSESLDEAVITNIDEKNALNDNQEIIDTERAEEMLRDILDKDKSAYAKYEELTNEQRRMKESVLQALGLKSLTPQQPEEKPKRDGYTGTLKAVIKLNRTGDKKRMVYRRSEDSMGELEYRICSEIPATDGVPITHLNDIAGIRKNVSKLHHDNEASTTATFGSVTSNGHTEEPETNNYDESKVPSTGKESNLIIPEKSSSFDIHPGRLCSDVCSYCFGKFGCLDTPCHIAQLKSERQKKILENEPHLTRDSCLCDACYRYVDRKANCPSKANATPGSSGGKTKVRPPASSQCCVNHCSQQATHTVKKKWLVKLKKSITNKVQSDKLDIDLDKSAAMYFPLCAQHHYWVDYFTVCGICRKRLNRNHLYSLGTETDRLNLMLAEDGIPARLSDKLFLCKLCRYYSNLRLKYADPGSIPPSGRIFYRDYRRKILVSLDIPVSDSDEEQIKDDKKKGLKKPSIEREAGTNGVGTSTKSEESVMSLSNLATLLGDQPEQQARIQVKFGNVNIGQLSNLNIGQGGREERSPYSDVGLQANLEFQGPAVPDGSWERCVSTIQFDKRTKKLWQDLQKPYGNQSSFLRHLVMLEKYWRAGYLCLAQGADERAAKYLNGVKNRIKAFEGSSDKPLIPSAPTAAPTASNEKFPLITNTGEIEVTPLKVAQKKANPPIMVEKKQMTPLDRAKTLVRMIQPTQRFPAPMQRYPVPMYYPYSYAQSQHNHHQQQQPPPLLKIRNKSISQAYYSALPAISMTQNLKPILPKLPRTLTVTQVPQGGAAITLNRSGITIEKQSGSPLMPALPIEKPSISVFREPAPGPP